MQDFVDGELEDVRSEEIVEHVRFCKVCQMELRDLLALYVALHQVVDADPCQSVDVLKDYVNGKCSGESADTIKRHIEFCSRCSLYVWSLRASEEELAEWQAKKEQEYSEDEAQELGRDRARKVLLKLLPGKADQIDSLWQSVLMFVSEMKDKAAESWQGLEAGMQLAGGLGFTESYDPETEAAYIIMITTLYVSLVASSARREDLEAATRRVAAKLGAGRELQKRLVDVLPFLVLMSE